jgi:hypothetical protein
MIVIRHRHGLGADALAKGWLRIDVYLSVGEHQMRLERAKSRGGDRRRRSCGSPEASVGVRVVFFMPSAVALAFINATRRRPSGGGTGQSVRASFAD